jgi:CelD/BcsL family acetyltransferase involved in cellulose biosynthesis
MPIQSLSANGIEVRLEPVTDRDRLAAAWRALEPRCEPSFFQSWAWIGAWLRHLPSDRKPFAAIAARNDEVIGLGVFVPGTERRRGLAAARTLRLHESGAPALDSLFIEHNGLLAERAHAPEVWAAVLGRLLDRGAKAEVVLGGLAGPAAAACGAAARTRNLEVAVRQRRPFAWLDLDRLRRTGRPFALALSRNTRHQLVRARALYQASGPLSLRPAQSAEEALAMLDGLKMLHQRSWRRRGRPGCFAAAGFEAFHRDLIFDRFRHGEIRLLCACAGDRPFGYLYNFASGGRIYAYQSGFDYPDDGRFKPGLVSHALAIEQALQDGFAVYDFMAGENRLKASFASDWGEMVWLAVRRRSARSWLERRFAGSRPDAVSPCGRFPDRPDDRLPARAGALARRLRHRLGDCGIGR